MTVDQSSSEEILSRFALTCRREPEALGRFCLDHPELSSQLIALAHEIALQDARAGDESIDAATEQWIATASAALAQPSRDPFVGLSGQAYQSLRQALGVPSVVLNALRDRLVAGGTVPMGFLERLANGLGAEMVEVAAYLAGPPKLARSQSHKSLAAPQAASTKISFAEVLDEAGLSREQAAALLADDD